MTVIGEQMIHSHLNLIHVVGNERGVSKTTLPFLIFSSLSSSLKVSYLQEIETRSQDVWRWVKMVIDSLVMLMSGKWVNMQFVSSSSLFLLSFSLLSFFSLSSSFYILFVVNRQQGNSSWVSPSITFLPSSFASKVSFIISILDPTTR